VAEGGTIIAGHGRLEAAKKLGLDEVPVIIARGWTDEQRRAYTIADNQIALNSTWDDDLLRVELRELKVDEFDLSLTGLDKKLLDKMLTFAPTDGLGDADTVPELQAEVVSRPGDVWLLGKHRLICGSSTDKTTVERLLGGEKPHLMVTDPPYGVEYDASWRDDRAGKTGQTGTAKGKVLNDDIADWREAWALFPGDVAYVWHADLRAREVVESLEACQFKMRAQIIWAKSQLAMSRGHYHFQHEPCWYAVRSNGTGHWAGDRKQTTLWQIDKPKKSETGHSTQKPVECMKRPIENNSEPGDAVYEPFSGSGTTIIAAEMVGRRCYAVELNPAYVDMAIRRWQDFTGDAAFLDGGPSFAEAAIERASEAALA
jgi:DNA modification methylase